ncbi:MAG: RNA polymerase sigma factor [Bacteroidia bacterium]
MHSIIEACKKKDHSAFEKLYNRYATKMKAVAYRYVGDSALAEDVLHDAFIKVYEKIESLLDNSVFEGWLRRIVVNESLDFLKKKKKLDKVLEESGQLSKNFQSDDKGAYKNISPSDLLKALNSLPTGYRTVFNLHVIDGFQHKEIAERLNISEGTSKSQLAKAKDFLKKQLENKLQVK